jgi:Fe-S cluster biogenesis protein NfuA
VQEDGGDIRYVSLSEEETGVGDGTVGGSCVGCPSSAVVKNIINGLC